MDCSNKNSAWNSQPTKRSLNLRTMAVEKTTTSRLKHTGVTKKTREYQTTQKKHTPTKRRVFLLEAVKVDGFWSNVFFFNISWIFKDFCCRSFFHAFHNVWPCFLIGLFEPSLPRNSYIIIYIYIFQYIHESLCLKHDELYHHFRVKHKLSNSHPKKAPVPF